MLHESDLRYDMLLALLSCLDHSIIKVDLKQVTFRPLLSMGCYLTTRTKACVWVPHYDGTCWLAPC